MTTRRRLGAPVLLWASLAAFTLAFLGTSALGMGPDEPVHYTKAAASIRGDLLGTRLTVADVRREYPLANPADASPAERTRARLTARSGVYAGRYFSLPPDVAVGGLFPCFAQQRSVSAACQGAPPAARDPERVYSYVGGYPPVPYLVAGAGTLVPGSRAEKWFGARLIGAAVALALLAVAVALAAGGRRPAWRIAGVAVAVVPTAVFLLAVVNASAWEIAGGLVVAAAVVRLGRDPDPTAREWAGIAVGAVALSVARPLGPFWLVPFAVLLVARIGPARVRALWRSGRAPKVTTGVVALAAGSTLVWVRATDANLPVLGDRIPEAFRLAVSDLWLVVLQIPAIFGWNDTPVAVPWSWIYGLGLVALVTVALVFASARERWTLVLAIAGTLSAAIFIAAIPFEMYRQRYAMQARYVLPFAVVIPLLVGDLLARAADRAPRSRAADGPWYPSGTLLPALLIAGMTVLQLVGWWTNAVRNAAGFGGFAFWGGEWSPRFGWIPWVLVATVGVGCGLGAAVAVALSDPDAVSVRTPVPDRPGADATPGV
ncbi:MAG: DUF2142 domain-containing protein [Actinomycetota bacterium]